MSHEMFDHKVGTVRVRVSERFMEITGFPERANRYYDSDGNRGVIKEFSKKSSSRLRRYLFNTTVDYQTMITLTIPSDVDISPKDLKLALDVFLLKLTKRHTWRSVVWVMEFTEKGVPHFHLLCNFYIDKYVISEYWANILSVHLGNQYEKALRAGTRVEALRDYGESVRYMTYLLKKKGLPRETYNGRYWGIRGVKGVVTAATYEIPIVNLTYGALVDDILREVSYICKIFNKTMDSKADVKLLDFGGLFYVGHYVPRGTTMYPFLRFMEDNYKQFRSEDVSDVMSILAGTVPDEESGP